MKALWSLLGLIAVFYYGGIIVVSFVAGFLNGLGLDVENPFDAEDPAAESMRLLLWFIASVLLASLFFAWRMRRRRSAD